tara:strand:+ start:810 stop:1637 length:828 start_codon:yes stop_codon:yes gene_type:complete
MRKSCLICSGSVKKINSYSHKCEKCGFHFSTLSSGYGQDVKGLEHIRKQNFRKILTIILNLKKKPKILEIGSGDGYFVEECIDLDISIFGSEASLDSFKKLKKKFQNKAEIYNLSLPESIIKKTKTRFDFIVFNDVFEHLTNLHKVINASLLALKKDGIIIINSPTSDGIIFKVSLFLMNLGFTKFYDRLWQKNMSSPHLSYFNKKNLNLLFSKHNFYEFISGNLNSLDINNSSRFNNLFDSGLKRIVFSILCYLFFFLQKILPKDIMFVFFKHK